MENSGPKLKANYGFKYTVAAFFTFGLSFAQEEEIYSIFFEFDKFNLKEEQAEGVIAFVQKIISHILCFNSSNIFIIENS